MRCLTLTLPVLLLLGWSPVTQAEDVKTLVAALAVGPSARDASGKLHGVPSKELQPHARELTAIAMKSDSLVRLNIVEALARLGPEELKVAIQILTAMLQDDSWPPGDAAGILAKIGPEAKSAGPRLVDLIIREAQLPDLFITFRRYSTTVLSERVHRRVGGKEAAEALGAMGSSVASLLPRLTDLRPRLKNYGEQKKDDNILALGDEVQAAIDKIKGVHDGKTCAQWIAQLRGPDNDARRKAQAALRVIGLTAVSPLAKLAVADPDAAVRLAAIQALRTGSAGTLAVTDLLKCLKDSELPVRQAAAHALTETAVRVIQGDRIWEVQRYANPIVSGLEQAAKVAQGQEAENLRACLKKIQN